MKRRLKALDGLITELGNMEYEDLETRRFRQPSSLSEGEAGARTSERVSTSLPTGGNPTAGNWTIQTGFGKLFAIKLYNTP